MPPVNITYNVATGSLPDGEPLTVYQYWFFWPGCQLAPTSILCTQGHSNNVWEPLYIYWKTTNPAAPTLLAVFTRIHFIWRQTGGANVQLNGTQVVLKLGFGSVSILGTTFTGIVPAVFTTGLLVNLVGSNSSISFPYQQLSNNIFSPGGWIYPLTNGGPHGIPLILDQNSPPATGPTAYEPGAGPADPFTLYGTGKNIQEGAVVGTLVTVGFFFIFAAGLAEERKIRAWLAKKRHF